MDSFEARSTYSKNRDDSVSVYHYMNTEDIEINRLFIRNLQLMFADNCDSFTILGKYKVSEMQLSVISVGTMVTLNDGSSDSRYAWFEGSYKTEQSYTNDGTIMTHMISYFANVSNSFGKGEIGSARICFQLQRSCCQNEEFLRNG